MLEPRRRRSRAVRAVAASVAVSLGVGIALMDSAAPAAADTPRAQAVGRFLDGAAGGTPLQSVVDLKDARATNPGTVVGPEPASTSSSAGRATSRSATSCSCRAAATRSTSVPPTRSPRLDPTATPSARPARSATRAASRPAVRTARPSNATFDLSAAAFPSTPLPLPGSGGAAALGGLTASIGAVFARAHTPPGVGVAGDTRYGIGSLTLTLASPALGGVLKQLGRRAGAADAAQRRARVPEERLLVQGPGAVDRSRSPVARSRSTRRRGSITIDLAALLRTLGANLNALPANTDLLAYLLNYLGSANGLSAGPAGRAVADLRRAEAELPRLRDRDHEEVPAAARHGVEDLLRPAHRRPDPADRTPSTA